jgi:putative spermidine/putrescine transport system permease protein
MAAATHAAAAGLPHQMRPNAAAFTARGRAEQWRLGCLALPGLLLIGIVALAPIAWLFWLSFRDADGATLVHYRRLLHPSYLITLKSTFALATYVSLAAAILTMLLSTLLGTLAAYGLHALRNRWSVFALGVFILPLVIPAILTAIGIFLFYAQVGLNNTLTGIVLAHSALAIPLVVITVASGLKSYDMNQEMVARSLGASRPRAFLTITLPQIRISVISGALLAFISSLDEVVIALFIAGGDKATLTRRMLNALRDEIDPTIASISTLLILLSVLLLALSQLVQSRSRRTG